MGEILFHLMRSCSLYSVGIGMLLCPDNCATKIGLASANIRDDDDENNDTDLTLIPKGLITSRLDSE